MSSCIPFFQCYAKTKRNANSLVQISGILECFNRYLIPINKSTCFHLLQTPLILGRCIYGPCLITPLQLQMVFSCYICAWKLFFSSCHFWSSSLKSVLYSSTQTCPKTLLPPIKHFKAIWKRADIFMGRIKNHSTMQELDLP